MRTSRSSSGCWAADKQRGGTALPGGVLLLTRFADRRGAHRAEARFYAMTSDRDILLSAAKLAQSAEPFVLITVIRTQGSTPRDAGAKMIYVPDALVVTIEQVKGSGYDRMVQNLRRWSAE